MLTLTTKAKGLKAYAINVEALARSQDTEIARLRLALATTDKEKEEALLMRREFSRRLFVTTCLVATTPLL